METELMSEPALLSRQPFTTPTVTIHWLVYGGALPFVFAALLVFFPGLAGLFSLSAAQVAQFAAFYGLAIISFISGSHWGLLLPGTQFPALRLPDGLVLKGLLASNAIVVAAWVSVCFLSVTSALIIEVLCFAVLLVSDRALLRAELIAHDYYRLRQRISAIVVGALALILLGLNL